ncbi:Hypothetical_protein [Hexamita inflata]|uniref:Hypothetical_protein n=1 Tax=Hexamita inflata TaxID=28002 RepID=A0AA86QM10_9EUKA|nr:Hypothetical protein HINF_LOCUS48403 [Hexamita inflata]
MKFKLFARYGTVYPKSQKCPNIYKIILELLSSGRLSAENMLSGFKRVNVIFEVNRGLLFVYPKRCEQDVNKQLNECCTKNQDHESIVTEEAPLNIDQIQQQYE